MAPHKSAVGVACVALMATLGVTSMASAAPAKSTGPAVNKTASLAGHSAQATMKADLHRLRVCESGNHYRLDTGNGYYGAYQFSASTWHALGYKGRPDQAKAKTQDAAAKKEHRAAGWSAWPSCSSREHLR